MSRHHRRERSNPVSKPNPPAMTTAFIGSLRTYASTELHSSAAFSFISAQHSEAEWLMSSITLSSSSFIGVVLGRLLLVFAASMSPSFSPAAANIVRRVADSEHYVKGVASLDDSARSRAAIQSLET